MGGVRALPAQAGGTGLGIVAMINQKFRPPGRFVVMRQVQDEARKVNSSSGCRAGMHYMSAIFYYGNGDQ